MKQVYKKNLTALAKINAKMAKKIDDLEPQSNDFKVEPIQNRNDYTLRLDFDDKERLVHSAYNPYRQAEKAIGKLDLEYYNLIGVAGVGCGYYIREILRRFNHESQLVVIENRLDILKEVMMQQDLTDIFVPRNVTIFDGSDPKYISRMKKHLRRIDYNALVAGNVNFFKTPGLEEKEVEKYKQFRKKFFATLHFVVRTLGNSSQDTLIGIRQALVNSDQILQSTQLNKIDEYQGQPAVCVAAGPSLDKNIEILKEYQKQVLILCADTVLEKLLNKGIKPDIVGSLERGEKIYNYFFKDLIEENKISDKIILAAAGVINNKTYDNFPGPKVTVFRNTIPTERWFGEVYNGATSLDLGNSVANLNFSVAHELGCSPIVLVGQDLAFAPDGQIHTSGTQYGKDEKIKDKWTIVEVEGYEGQKLKTRKWWKIFKEWFEYRILETGIKCIDATEGGALIKGTEVMTLEETADKYFKEEVPPFDKELNVISDGELDKRESEFYQAAADKVAELKKVKEEISAVINMFEESRTELDEQEDISNYVQDEFSRINTKIAELTKISKFFYFVMQPVYIQYERYKVKLGSLSVNPEEKYKEWCEYGIDTFEDIKEICEITIDTFYHNLDKFEKEGEKSV